MRILLSSSFSSPLYSRHFAKACKPVAERVAEQNALFDEQYESDLRNFPERATAFGDYRYNDRLNDYSLAAIAQRHKDRPGLPATPGGHFDRWDSVIRTSSRMTC